MDCTIDNYKGTCGRGRVNGGDKGEGIWLMDFEYIHMYIYICIHIYMKEK
jgi:hypothetical protein